MPAVNPYPPRSAAFSTQKLFTPGRLLEIALITTAVVFSTLTVMAFLHALPFISGASSNLAGAAFGIAAFLAFSAEVIVRAKDKSQNKSVSTGVTEQLPTSKPKLLTPPPKLLTPPPKPESPQKTQAHPFQKKEIKGGKIISNFYNQTLAEWKAKLTSGVTTEPTLGKTLIYYRDKLDAKLHFAEASQSYQMDKSEENQKQLEKARETLNTYSTKKTSTVYSDYLPAEIKLAKQTCKAVKKGFAYKKRKKYTTPFSVQNGENFKSHDFFSDSNGNEIKIVADSSIDLENCGAAQTQGKREEMEDAHVVQKFWIGSKAVTFAAVFDGHADKGKRSAYAKENLPMRIVEAFTKDSANLTDQVIADKLVKVFVEFDNEVQKVITDESAQTCEGGTTATCALIFEDGRVFIPNVGDSGTVVVREDVAYMLSEPADPTDDRFLNAVEKIPELVYRSHEGRIYGPEDNGSVNFARDLGIPYLSARPKITKMTLDIEDVNEDTDFQVGYKKNDYLVLACDGLWDVCSPEDLYTQVHVLDKAGKSPAEISQLLIQAALDAGSTDNISVVVVKL